ncbi:MAG TPA: PQQ-binding-like beta-propeller repeat protein [Planctomycetota bacterium]|nr:PQQ-binding-like beta-propeller repeat protein [Planctomycetota bacterium]
MRRMLPAFSVALLVVASAARGAQEPPPRTWIDHVRFHTLRALKDLGREFDAIGAAMRRSMTGLKDDTTKGISSVTREGRRGLASASKALSHAAATAYRETHDTFLNAGRTIVPGVATQREPATPLAATRKIESPILAPHFLRGHDILLAWQLDTGGRAVRASAIFEDRLLLETEDQNLYSFEPPTGILQWLYGLPAPSQSGYGDDPNEPRSILVIAKDVYYEIDRMVGRPRRRIVLPFPASNPPVVRGDEVIINSWERRVCALDRETRTREWSYVPEENVVGAVASAPDLIYAADVAGNLVAYSVPGRREKWTYKAHDAFRVSPVLHLIDVIVPAEDMFVHCVNRFSGLCRWKYPVQGPVTQPVWADGDVVYFSADGDAFYALDARDGKLLWRCPKGGWPVAVGRENLYIQGAEKEVWCLDRKTGEKKWSVSAEPFTYFVRNTVNDHIYLCTARGEVYAFYLRGDHLEKKAPPAFERPKPKVKGVEEPEPGGVGPSELPAPRPTLPAPRPPVEEKAEEAPEEVPPAAPPEPPEKAEDEEVPPAAKGLE